MNIYSSGLQIRGGIENSSKVIFFLFLNEKHVLTPHQNHLIVTVVMMSHKISFFMENP